MRHSDPGGRFTIPWEHKEIFRGIDGELRAPVGMHVQWIEFDPGASSTDVIYDVGDQTVGRRWKEPIRIPAYMSVIYQGVTMQDIRGFYNTDILRVSVAMNVMEDVFPELVWEPDGHDRDRVLFRGKVFVPIRLNLRGALRNAHTIFTVEAQQVNPEEYVNDPQLLEWANRSASPPNPHDPQRVREGSTL
jgi:hypothetical protein